MSWRIAIRHRTGYKYAEPVRASYNEARLTPPSVDGQHTLQATLVVTPAARPAAQAGAAFLALHALVHVWDTAAGREHVHQLLIDLPTVFLPPALAIWIAFMPARRGATLAKGGAR